MEVFLNFNETVAVIKDNRPTRPTRVPSENKKRKCGKSTTLACPETQLCGKSKNLKHQVPYLASGTIDLSPHVSLLVCNWRRVFFSLPRHASVN